VRNEEEVFQTVSDAQPDSIFHLAGQVAMTTSIEDPRLDFEVNALGTLNILEAVRAVRPECHVIYSSTNKVYGDLRSLPLVEGETRYILPDHPDGIGEEEPLEFHSPYGCSKGAADQYMLDYHRIYGLNTTVFRHSTVYGGRQFSTYDQGWIGWFCTKATEFKNGSKEPFTISGNGKQVRDILSIDDCVRCYIQASDNPTSTAGRVYNIGGGPANSLSILELLSLLEAKMDVRLRHTEIPWRASDQKVFIADVTRAEKEFNWRPMTSLEEGMDRMIAWISELSGKGGER
jgi:CDP-paratose 2-epimerase